MPASNLSGYSGNFNPGRAVVIADGEDTSDVIPLNGFCLCGIITPAALTGSAFTFLVSNTVDGTYVPLKVTTSGTAFSQTVAANGYYALDPNIFQGVAFLKIKSGSTEAAERTLICSVKGL